MHLLLSQKTKSSKGTHESGSQFLWSWHSVLEGEYSNTQQVELIEHKSAHFSIDDAWTFSIPCPDMSPAFSI